MGSTLRRPGPGQLALLDRDNETRPDENAKAHARAALRIARAAIAQAQRKEKQ